MVTAAVLFMCLSGPPPIAAFVEKHCLDCHDADTAKGGLDLTALPLEPKVFDTWAKVHDRVRDGEMPPAKRSRPPRKQATAFLAAVAEPLAAADRARDAAAGRTTSRRLNRFEYENSLRDLFGAPWLQIKEMLPEDGEAFRFNKVGEALDISHVQMAQYLAAAEYAIGEVLASQTVRPEPKTVRYYTREMGSFARKMKFTEFNRSPERATFPVLGFAGQADVRAYKTPLTGGPTDREEGGMAVVAGAYEPLEPKFDEFVARQAGRYKIRLNAHSIWVGPGKAPSWWRPDLDTVSRGRRSEPITLYTEKPPHQLRRIGAFDAAPTPTIGEFEVYLLKGETIRPDPARLFRSRPPNWHNPLATEEGQPGVNYRWLEVEGPLVDEWPPAGRRLLFGESTDPKQLMENFLRRAYRRPVAQAEIDSFVGLVKKALDRGVSFPAAMRTGYAAVLCSPGFIFLEEKAGPLDDFALASRLSYFLWNSSPDETLRSLARQGLLTRPAILRAQTQRMLDDPRSRRFVDLFLDYWLDLRRVNATSPDAGLYPDYYLDDLLVESAAEETQLFFAELVRKDLPARNVVSSNFLVINERLATHYGLRGVDGVNFRRVPLPAKSPRGGLMTQASVLKVTANGTTTSPVLRGVWVMERILGKPSPPPPPSVPAVEPDTRGATTIREQLDKHRSDKTCAACHARIDPAGFALESFDVLGGWRDQYRALGDGGPRPPGYGKNGQPFEFHLAQPVDPAGDLPGGGAFLDIVELKRLLLRDERQIARNLVRQLLVFGTGAPVRFGDRAQVEAILDGAGKHHGVRTLISQIVSSELFRSK